ncbi:preprotein translocase subunit SecE [Tissierella pigra]|uniref:Protein translocase subunit SecE n=1 Tax=Tissierella pigra TaxID=2607614 RepID=A0A6N7Y0X2_9FIRM|nr:preprotein translocase subunit SecE [Tissierella pigra]MBU5425637.1 preprotein translocase subunit SecE [Tissierella pigra]MSU03393.1 preprotein translocase subunit SecE [Tissierella pigra]
MTAPTGTKKTKMSTYFRGVKSEMKKVIWPSKKELINYTGIVIMISVIVAIIVWVLDLIIHGGLQFII